MVAKLPPKIDSRGAKIKAKLPPKRGVEDPKIFGPVAPKTAAVLPAFLAAVLPPFFGGTIAATIDDLKNGDSFAAKNGGKTVAKNESTGPKKWRQKCGQLSVPRDPKMVAKLPPKMGPRGPSGG